VLLHTESVIRKLDTFVFTYKTVVEAVAQQTARKEGPAVNVAVYLDECR
jgi:hypothetical protein